MTYGECSKDIGLGWVVGGRFEYLSQLAGAARAYLHRCHANLPAPTPDHDRGEAQSDALGRARTEKDVGGTGWALERPDLVEDVAAVLRKREFAADHAMSRRSENS